MRRALLLIFILISLGAYSQELRVRSIRRIEPAAKGSYLLSGVVPGKGQLLVSGSGYRGLMLLDIRKGRLTEITSGEGAGYEPAVTADGKRLYYRSDSFEGNVRQTAVYSYDLATGESARVTAPGRDVPAPAVSGNSVLLKSRGEMKREHAGAELKPAEGETFVVIDELRMVLYRDGERKVLTPNGDGFYIWASLSPDGSMILYNYRGLGTYVCDLEGNIIHSAGRINAPKWFGNRIVIGMDDHDDGYRITSSELVYYSLGDGRRAVLTSEPGRADMFPFPVDSRRIAFCTDQGEIYIMKVRVR